MVAKRLINVAVAELLVFLSFLIVWGVFALLAYLHEFIAWGISFALHPIGFVVVLLVCAALPIGENSLPSVARRCLLGLLILGVAWLYCLFGLVVCSCFAWVGSLPFSLQGAILMALLVGAPAFLMYPVRTKRPVPIPQGES